MKKWSYKYDTNPKDSLGIGYLPLLEIGDIVGK